MSMELNKESVEQAGGDERAAFEAWLAQAMSKKFEPEFDLAKYEDSGEYRYSPAAAYWKAWQARAALAQPSPAKPEQTEAERPEVVGYLATAEHPKHGQPHKALNYFKDQHDAQVAHWRERGCEVSEDELMAVAQHERIAASRWERAMDLMGEHVARISEKLTKERDAALVEVERLRQFERICEGLPQDAIDGGWTVQGIRGYAKLLEDQLKSALARVAKLEHSQSFQRDIDYSVLSEYAYKHRLHFNNLCAVVRSALIALPAQAQHSVPEVSGIGRDTGHPRAVVLYLSKAPTDDDLRAIHDALRSLAAAPGKEVPQAWIDVQAERRRQVEAEGWTPEHDDEHSHGQMARAAACYALAGSSAPNDGTAALLVSLAWPWDEQWWKPTTTRRDLVKACALGLAEIERLDRAAAPGKEVGHE
ncbi:hypothetical protein [Pseudomonas aeruginosa]|uniref:hypothetical protein n=2 Tax=Pseudomonas aeruginosa TaxID=287 RepID=UPI000A6F9C80|nr:hypothetical protein [Pseudomonas aeruginosa]